MSLSHAQATQRFYDVIWPLRGALLRTASFLMSPGSQAEDLVQETLMKAFRAIESLDVKSNPQAWLMSILRNTRIDKLRAQARSPETVGLEDLDVAAPLSPPERADQNIDPAETLEQFSDREIIRALQQLPEDIRWTLLLVDVEQMEYEQAAAILDIPAGTAKSRVHRGRMMLRNSLLAAGAANGEAS